MADSTRTDPRFHPAYQRGYRGQGAPGVSATPAEERFRRPRGAEAGELRRSTTLDIESEHRFTPEEALQPT